MSSTATAFQRNAANSMTDRLQLLECVVVREAVDERPGVVHERVGHLFRSSETTSSHQCSVNMGGA